jgi:DNA polymerase-1
MADRRTLVLIDGHAHAYRMFYALSVDGFATRKGEPTNATYGFTRALLDIITGDEPPDYLAVSFDVGKTFRDDLYSEYKGTREKMPDELSIQMERIRQIVQAFNIPILEAEGYEADDVLGTVARLAEEADVQTLIVTGDRDLLQLVTGKTHVQLPGRRQGQEKTYNPEAVRERYGLEPEQIVDFKALVGDPSDNIPGVAGVGEKTATKLLQEYGTLEAIYEHLDEVESTRFRNALERGKETALLSQRLAQIATNVPIDFDLEACRTHDFQREVVAELFREVEFRSLIGRLPGAPAADDGTQMPLFEAPAAAAPVTTTILVTTEAALDELVVRLEEAEAIAFDTETTSVDQMRADLVGISLAVEEGEGYYVPVGHTEGEQLSLDTVLERLRPALTDSSIPKVGHNVKYDYVVLARYGLEVAPLSFDTMIAEWLLNPQYSRGKLGLKSMAFLRMGVEMTDIAQLIGSGRKQITMDRVAVADAAPYAAADADMSLRLAALLEPGLHEKGLWDLFAEVEMPLLPVLAEMEMRGVLLDTGFLAEMSEEVSGQLAGVEREIAGYVGEEINLNSTQQLSDALFVKLGLPTEGLRKTSSGRYSTAVDVLGSLRGKHPVVELIMQHRELSKLKSTYLDALPQLVNPETGRLHTSYNPTGTVTGRISSSDPNLQNIPIRTELGRRIRGAFVAAPGHVLMGADYSQVELRVLAHISGDERLREAFRQGRDIHASTAAAVLGVSPDAVTVEQRGFAKRVNFGLLYGMSAFRLAQETNLTLADAEEYVRAYFDSMPGVEDYLDMTKHRAARDGYVETLLGRRRYFPVLQSSEEGRRDAIARRAAEREAINMPIQGTAADVIKIAMIRLHAALREAGLGARMLLQVHDELVLEVPEDEVDATARLVREVMEGAYQLNVPLRVDVHSGPSWYDLK